jgi:hypothetical protein
MPWKYNPFTDALDNVGSGGGTSYIDGDVEYHSNLPVAVGSPAVNSAFLVRKGEGLYFFSRKPAGIWVRELNNGNLDDWKYAGTFSDLYRDANFRIINDTDTSKELAFSLSGISASTTVTLTVPASSGTIALNPMTTAGDIVVGGTSGAPARLALGTPAQQLRVNSGQTSLEYFTPAAAFDPASPPAIGGTTPAAISGTTGTFTTLTATPSSGSALTLTGGTVTASAPLIDASQTWNASGTTFTGVRFNVTNTQSAAASTLFDFQLAGSSRLRIERGGAVLCWGTSFGIRISEFTIAGAGGGMNITSGSGSTGFNLDSGTIATLGCSLFDQKNGTTAQEYRLAGTHTSSTNYQRMTIKSVKQTLSALSGASATTTGTFIPDGAVVVGVTTRVGTLLTGATGYTIGDGTDADRWGDITGTAVGTTSDNANWTAGTIECFTAGGNVTLTANGSNFTAGAIEICVFYLAGQAD